MSREDSRRLGYSERVQAFVARHNLFAPQAHVLVALSGGADSVALLRILLRLGYQCHAVHCNFHLRGEESNRDERFVANLCQTLGVEYEVVHFDTQAYAAEQKVSVEMAARELRYREFERIRRALALDVVAVAHHQDDAVETLLLNLIRGAGINGLTGMKVKNGHVVRPLLCLTRDEIIDYLDRLGQAYVTDSTNLTDEYARNKVRLQLLPLMQQINPAASANIARSATHLADAAYIYNKVIGDNCRHMVKSKDGGIDIDIAALLAVAAPETHLYEILAPYGFHARQVSDIYRSLDGESGRMFYTSEYILLKDRTALVVRPVIVTEAVEYILPSEGLLELPDGVTIRVERLSTDDAWRVPKRADVLCIDAERIYEPLVMRHPREGDRFSPFGMRGTKLMSDFCTDLKMNLLDRQRQWLLCCGNDIVWVVGLRGSERYRITDRPKEIIMLTLVKDENKETL